jgi:hypothetical protein
VDVETLIDLNKCTVIKLLHRDKLRKDILIDNINMKNEVWWLYKDIKRISEYLDIEIERVCCYPDITRKMILEKYYKANLIEEEIREEIENLIKDYSFKTKKKVKEIVYLFIIIHQSDDFK